MAVQVIEGDLTYNNGNIYIVASRFNSFIVDHLVAGAIDTLKRHGTPEDKLTVVKVPGAYELPLFAKKVADKVEVDGVIALGAVIRGGTPHFDYVSSECTKGLASASLDSGKPVAFGVLTTDSIEQAIERAGTKAGNKGSEAALSLLESLNVLDKL